jgi:hypothetical protein
MYFKGIPSFSVILRGSMPRRISRNKEEILRLWLRMTKKEEQNDMENLRMRRKETSEVIITKQKSDK